MRFGFVTCVQLGLTCMEEIYRVGGSLDCAVTLLDDSAPTKSGRVHVDSFCVERAIPLKKVRNINDNDAVSWIRDQSLDWLFIIGWSQIAKGAVLGSVREGVLGIHPTLLPEGRGRAAIPWAILKGLSSTGVTLFQLDEGVDTGPIIAQLPIEIGFRENASSLYRRVEAAHGELIRAAWPQLANGSFDRVPQDDSRASYWPGRKPEDGRILPSMTVEHVERLVRAVTRPYPGAFVETENRTLRIWSGSRMVGEPKSGAEVLTLADGLFEALEFEWE